MNALHLSISVASWALPWDADAPRKGAYTLFNPTPRELMREMSTDRPDTTESPYTVDAGHVQVELSFFDYVRDGDDEAFSVMPTNVKLGLTNTIDVQVVFEPYIHTRSADPASPGMIDTDSGLGDTQVRLKINLWGNDEGDSAAAVMPFVQLPTAADGIGHGHLEGGVIIPFAISLDEHWGVGLMAEFDAIYNATRDAYDLEFLHTLAIGRDLIGDLGAYVEYIGVASTAPDSQYQVLLGTGLTYALNADWRFDAGVNLGLAGGAPDINPFVGMSVRF